MNCRGGQICERIVCVGTVSMVTMKFRSSEECPDKKHATKAGEADDTHKATTSDGHSYGQSNDQLNEQLNDYGRDNLDSDGYRPNVGIIVCNRRQQVLWARRVRKDGWQFPQGGVEASETIEQAVFRELNEEVGLSQEHVRLIGRTQRWLHYDLPERLRRFSAASSFRGQKQIWFLFELTKHDSHVSLSVSSQPEFDAWRWVDYWLPLEEIVGFKKDVYRRALTELEPMLRKVGAHPTAKE